MTWESKANWKDPKWKYVGAAQTDISKTLARVRKEMAEVQDYKLKIVKIKKDKNEDNLLGTTRQKRSVRSA